MREWQRQAHVKHYCKYHVVFVPKYRMKSSPESQLEADLHDRRIFLRIAMLRKNRKEE
jgi:REP element-mobilizing transposase RayT